MVSNSSLGGLSHVNPNIQSIIDVFEIKKIENGAIQLKKTKELVTYKNGQKKEEIVGAGFLNGTGMTNGMVMVALAAPSPIGNFIFFRARKSQTQVRTIDCSSFFAIIISRGDFLIS
jgi:hypothetical protein